MVLFLSAYFYIYFWHAQCCLFQEIKGNFVSHSKSFNSTFTHFNISVSEGQQQHGDRYLHTQRMSSWEMCMWCSEVQPVHRHRRTTRAKARKTTSCSLKWGRDATSPLRPPSFSFSFFLLPSFLGLQLKAECLQAWVQSRLRPADKWVDNTLIVFLGLRVLSGIDLVSRSMHSELRVIFWRTVSKYLFEMQQ